MSDTSDTQPKSRTPHCSRCSNHKIKQEMRNHKGKCPFQDCECPNCEMTKQRQKILNAEIQVYRKRRADLNKKSNSDRKIVKSRKRLSHDEKLSEVLFKQMEDKIKNVIRKFVIRSSGNAGFDVENWISKGLEMSNNSEYFPQTSSFASTQPTIQHSVNGNQSTDDSSSETSIQQPESANSSPTSSTFSPQNYETQQNFNCHDEPFMDVEQSFTENVEFNTQDFQNLINDLESRLTVASVTTQECNKLDDNCEDLTTINQTFFLLEPQTQNQSSGTEVFHENSLTFSPTYQFYENQQFQYSITPLTNSEISQNLAIDYPVAYQVEHQNHVISNLRIPTPQSSDGSTCKSDCLENDTQAELELIDQVLENLSEGETGNQNRYFMESDINFTSMSIFD